MKKFNMSTSTNGKVDANVDINRRRSLKAIAAGVTAPLAPMVMGAQPQPLQLQTGHCATPRTPELPAAQHRHTHDLELHIFSSEAVVEDSLVLRNNLDETLVLKEIRPSLIVFNDRYVDLRKVIGDTPLSVSAGHTVSFMVYSQPLYGRDWSRRDMSNDYQEPADMTEYLWAHGSVSKISEDLVLVSAGAFVAGETALMYEKCDQPIAATVEIS